MIGVVSFPGSNGDTDALVALRDNVGVAARLVDYRETELEGFDGVVLPGGFSYGDHLRCGALARFAPILAPLRRFAARGGPVLGICNGFQILTEARLLPGALLRNKTLRFHCFWTTIRIEQAAEYLVGEPSSPRVLRLPVAHGDGAYYADEATLVRLEESGQVFARYCDAAGNISHLANPNGSKNAIAGISNDKRNIIGLMPHPERAADSLLGGTDGIFVLQTAFAFLSVPA